MANKKYDWMALLQYQPDYSLVDFKERGITPDNAEFKSRDYYKGLQDVQTADIFTDDDGKFDEAKFNKFYDSAAILYNNFANEEVFSTLTRSKTYDPWEWWNSDAEKIRDTSPRLQIGDENLSAVTRSIEQFGVTTETPFSTRELGQRHAYFDSEKGEWSDKTPNDYAGFFKSWTAPTLVLATYDEDTWEPDESGRRILHKKGEVMLDNGIPFYRTLRKDEDTSGKDFLLREDIVSVDLGKGNKFDIFDSDGKRTEGWKVAAHTVARVVPYLLPYVGQYYAYLMAAKNIAQFVPQFLKTVDGAITNDALSNGFGQTMNQAVSWMKRMDHGVSDYSREHLVTWENAGKMFADITGQLFEQKSIQGITQLFKSPSIKNNARLAKFLSYSYMSTTSAEEAYDIMKQAGANDRTAGLAMWALIGVYYKLMSADYYKHALFKDSWIDETHVKDSARKLADLYKAEIAIDPTVAAPTKEGAAKTANWFMRQWEKLLGVSDTLEEAGVLGGKTWASKALSEGVEEVMEEVGIDSIKGLAKALEALGVNVGDQTLDFGFSAEDVLQRYGMSFAGGAFGGAVFHGYNLLDKRYRDSFKNAKLPETVLGEIAEIVMQNRQGEIYDRLEKDREAGIYGSPNLSSTKFSVVRDVDGETVAFEGADNGMSQNDMIYNEAYKTVKFFEDLLGSEKFKGAVERVKETTKLNTEQATLMLLGQGVNINDSAQNLILNDLKEIAGHIMKISSDMKVIEDQLRPTDEAGGEATLKERLSKDSRYQELVQELQYWRNERDRIYDKKEVSKYIGQASLALNASMMQALLGFHDVESYAQARFQKPYTELSDEQKYMADHEYKSYFTGDNPGIFQAFHLYNELSNRFKARLLEKDERLKNVIKDPTVKPESVGSDILKKRIRVTWLGKAIADTSAKETKTEQDEQNITKWTAEITKLNEELSKVGEIMDDSIVMHAHTDDFEDFSLFDFANALLATYKQTEGKHRYDDADLTRFINRVRGTYGINLLMAKLDNYVNAVAYSDAILNDEGHSYMQEHGIEDLDDFLWNPISSVLTELKDLLEAYYENLDNFDEATRIHNDILTLLRDRAKLTDEEIHKLLYEPIDETVGDPNLTLIPYFGRALPEIMHDIQESKSKAIYGDIIDLIKDFATIIKNETLIPMIDVLTQEEQRMINVGLKEYTIGNEFYLNQFKELTAILDTLDAIIGGAYDGTNNFLNPYRKNEKLEEYAVISENTGKILQDDIKFLKNRIQTLLAVDRMNSGQKLKEQKDVGANMRRKFLEKITMDVYIEDFKKEFGGIDLKQLMYNSTSADFNPSEITADNYAEKEPEIIKFETALFEEIKKKGYSEQEIIEKLVKVFGDNTLYKTRSTKLTKDKTENITAYDTILYMATILSLNSNDFYVLYNDAIRRAKESNPEFGVVPVYGQEYALRLAYAFAKNMSLFNGLLDKIATTGKDMTPYQAKRRILYNMVNVFGGASTGKTRGVAAMLKYLFPDAAFRFLAPTDVQVKTLLSVFGEDENSEKGSTVEAFITKINPGIDAASNVELDKKSKARVVKDSKAQDYDWYGDAPFKVLLIDESAMNNSIRLKAISEYAEKYGILVIALGDQNQNTAQLRYEVGKDVNENTTYQVADDGYEDCVSINTPYLVANFRAQYRSKVDNYSSLLGVLNRVADNLFENKKFDPESIDYNDALAKVLGGSKIKLKYYRTKDGLITGDFVDGNAEDFQTLLDKAIASGHSVLLVTDNSTNGKYIADKYNETDKFKRQTAEQAQGGEYDFVFVDKAVEPVSETSNEYNKLKDLYTLTQRSRMGSVILNPNGAYDRYVLSDPDPSSMAPWAMSAEQKSEYEKWRLAPLSKLVPSANFDENTKISEKLEPAPEQESAPVETPPIPGPNPAPAEKSDAVPEPDPELIPEPRIDNGEPKPEEEHVEREVDPDAEIAPHNPAIPIVQPITPVESRLPETSTELEREELVDWEAGRKATNPKPETWLDSVPEGAWEVGDFFTSVYTHEFFEEQRKDKASVYNYLKNEGITLTEDEYQTLIMWFSRKALQNDFDFSLTGDLKPGKSTALRLAQNKLKRVKAHSVQAVVTTKDTVSEIRIIVTNGTNYGTIFEVPITQSKQILQEGVINLDDKNNPPFKIYGRPWYHTDGKRRETIGWVRKHFPWLRFWHRAGTIRARGKFADELASYRKNKKSAENTIPEGMKDALRFVDEQDGKTFVIAYGIRTPDAPFQTTVDADGNSVLGKDGDISRRAGIQRIYPDINNLLKISAALDYITNLNYFGQDNATEMFLDLTGDFHNKFITALNLLKSLTGSSVWDPNTFYSVEDKKILIGAERYRAIRDAIKNSALISETQNTRIVADLFGELLRNPEQHKNDWLRLHTSFHNLTKSNIGLLIQIDPTHEYLFCMDPSETTPNTVRMFRTKFNQRTAAYDHSPIGEPVTFTTGGNPQAFTEGTIRTITGLLQSFKTPLSLENFTSERMRVGFARIEYKGGMVIHPNFDINNWVLMFSDFKNGTLSQLLNQDKFKQGLFAQYSIISQEDNSQFGESDFDDNDTTTAVKWHSEMIALNATPVKVQELNPAEVAVTQGYALSLLNNIENAARAFMESDVLQELVQKYEIAIKDIVDLNDEQTLALAENLITEINNYIRNNATSYGLSILELAPDGNSIRIVTDRNWKAFSYKNLIESANATIGDVLNYVYTNPVTQIDVVEATDTETDEKVYFIFHPQNGKIKVVKTQLFPQWKQLSEEAVIFGNVVKEIAPSVADIRNISIYLNTLLLGITEQNTMRNYLTTISRIESDSGLMTTEVRTGVTVGQMLEDLQNKIVNYLITRIENNEC